jgi:hypothetical protein
LGTLSEVSKDMKTLKRRAGQRVLIERRELLERLAESDGPVHEACTPIDHVYPGTARGTWCYCHTKQWGKEEKDNDE